MAAQRLGGSSAPTDCRTRGAELPASPSSQLPTPSADGSSAGPATARARLRPTAPATAPAGPWPTAPAGPWPFESTGPGAYRARSNAAVPPQMPVLPAAPTTATRPGAAAVSSATDARHASRRSAATCCAPLSLRTSNGGAGQSAAATIIGLRHPPHRARRRRIAADRRDHIEHLAGLDDVVRAEDPGALPRADCRGRQRAGEPVGQRRAQGLPHEVLVRDGDKDRPAGGGQLGQPPADLEGVPGVLAEVVRGVNHDPGGIDAGRDGAVGELLGVGEHVGYHVVVADTERPGPRRLPAGVRAHERRTGLGSY